MATVRAAKTDAQWMIYGANGYTGRLCAIEAVRRGMHPVLAGRNADALAILGKQLRLETRVFSLDDPRVVADNLGGIALVLHCAGPFSATSVPMLSACEHAHCHYLDITGEIDVFEYVHQRDAHWKRANIAAIPGVGFDVVPSDCLAAMLKRALPDATHLTLAFRSKRGKLSPGTAKTMVEGLPKGLRVRRGGHLINMPSGSLTRKIPFGSMDELAVAIPWGDVSTAFYSTQIPNIEVYLGAPKNQIRQMRWAGKLQSLLSMNFVQNYLKKSITKKVKGPSEKERAGDETILWGEVKNASGGRAALRMNTPEGYTLTVDASLTVVKRILEEGAPHGALTPSMAFGADFVTTLNGVKVTKA